MDFGNLDKLVDEKEVQFHEKFYREGVKLFQIAKVRQMVSDWLDEQEKKRRKSKETNALDELLDALM